MDIFIFFMGMVVGAGIMNLVWGIINRELNKKLQIEISELFAEWEAEDKEGAEK